MAEIIQRGDGKWLVRVFLGRDSQGKTRYHNKIINGNKRAAQTYARDIETRRDLGTLAETPKFTVNTYLDKWLKEAVKPSVRERTYTDYDDILTRYVRPAFGDRLLSELKPLDVQALYNSMSERGLSGRTVRYAHAVLSSALKQAVWWQILTSNAATYTKRPTHSRKEIQVLTPEEAERFVEAATSDRQGTVLRRTATTKQPLQPTP